MKKNDIIRFVGVVLIVIGLLIATFSYFRIKHDNDKLLLDINTYLEESKIEEDEVIDEGLIEDDNLLEEKKDSEREILMVLEIPKIDFKRGLYNKKSKYNNVKYNIQLLKESSLPNDENGNIIIAGHNGNSKVSFFNKLNKLSIDDYIYIYYNGIKYTYKIESIYQIEKDGMAEIYRFSDKNTITLITCSRKKRDKQEVYIGYLETKEKY